MTSESTRTKLCCLVLTLACGSVTAQAPALVSNLTPAAANGSPLQGAHDDHFLIGANDILAISVWREPEVSRSLPVRPDGKISLPLAGELGAAGRTPLQLEQDIALRLKSYIAEPQVTVIVQQINSSKYNILGEVGRPGSYPLNLTITVLDAIAAAGGFRDFAKQKGIYILRKGPDGAMQRIPFNYKDVIKGKRVEQNMILLSDDTIVVP